MMVTAAAAAAATGEQRAKHKVEPEQQQSLVSTSQQLQHKLTVCYLTEGGHTIVDVLASR